MSTPIPDQRIKELAHQILTGRIGIVEGARQMVSLLHNSGLERHPDCLIFIAVDSETDHLPTAGSQRAQWSPEALAKKDLEINEYETFHREQIMEACKKLLSEGINSRDHRAKQIQDAIGLILMKDWDPIGVSEVPEAEGEYDSYIGPVYRLLSSKANEDGIIDYLSHVEKNLMGLGTNRDLLRPVARKLLALDVSL